MYGKHEQIITRADDPYKIVTERLRDGKSDLKSFYFRQGANFYVFSYEKGGVRRHTLIDAGDLSYRNRILSILQENDVKPANIERIVLTHRHRDHCGAADPLAGESGAQILAQEDFQHFVASKVGTLEREWLGIFDPSFFQRYDVTYLPATGDDTAMPVAGVSFHRLTEPIAIGAAGYLNIFSCPKSAETHTPDQLVILHSPRPRPYLLGDAPGDSRPTEDIIFAGDLWLMHGPHPPRARRYLARRVRIGYNWLKSLLSGKAPYRRVFREQDVEAKEALKLGFSLIRVKPGHGEEFLGTRIIPAGLLADRDILPLVGHAPDSDKSLLKTDGLAARVSAVREEAYASFVQELLFWIDRGYTISEISDLLCRIYREQAGGDRSVAEDRRERRLRLQETLARLKDAGDGPDVLRQIAALTLPRLSP